MAFRGDNACFCWVNFSGEGSITIRDSFNVSTIDDNGTGQYKVNFSTDMTSDDYAVSWGGDGGTGEGHGQSQSNGSPGGSGASASPPAGNGGDGGDGGNGAAAGVAGQAGQDGNDSNTGATGGTGGAAGAAGAALDGADYDFTGVINTSGSNITIKGAIIGGTQI